MNPVVFSASSVNSYLDCHLRWFFAYILGMEGEQSEAQRVGIMAHDYAEKRLRGGDRASPLAIESIAAVFDHDILPTYRNPVLIEASFQISVNGIPFSGIIDSVDDHRQIYTLNDGRQAMPFLTINDNSVQDDAGNVSHGLVLRDLKTTGSRPKAGKYRFNMIGYWVGARELGHECDAAQLDYIVRTKTPYYWPEVIAAPDEDDIEWFAATLQSAADGVGRADYQPTALGTRTCLSCPYRSSCGPFSRYKEAMSG